MAAAVAAAAAWPSSDSCKLRAAQVSTTPVISIHDRLPLILMFPAPTLSTNARQVLHSGLVHLVPGSNWEAQHK